MILIDLLNKVLLILILFGGPASCAFNPSGKAPTENYKDKAYLSGYDDGCSSGQNAAGVLLQPAWKDRDHYDVEPSYRTGWDEGFKNCAENVEQAKQLIRRSP